MTLRAFAFALFALALQGCMWERRGYVHIVDPRLPNPTICMGNPWPCGGRGYIAMPEDVLVEAEPVGTSVLSDVPPKVVWYIELPPAGNSPLEFQYGIPVPGSREIVPARALERGMVYQIRQLHFVVRGKRIWRVRQ